MKFKSLLLPLFLFCYVSIFSQALPSLPSPTEIKKTPAFDIDIVLQKQVLDNTGQQLTLQEVGMIHHNDDCSFHYQFQISLEKNYVKPLLGYVFQDISVEISFGDLLLMDEGLSLDDFPYQRIVLPFEIEAILDTGLPQNIVVKVYASQVASGQLGSQTPLESTLQELIYPVKWMESDDEGLYHYLRFDSNSNDNTEAYFCGPFGGFSPSIDVAPLYCPDSVVVEMEHGLYNWVSNGNTIAYELETQMIFERDGLPSDTINWRSTPFSFDASGAMNKKRFLEQFKDSLHQDYSSTVFLKPEEAMEIDIKRKYNLRYILRDNIQVDTSCNAADYIVSTDTVGSLVNFVSINETCPQDTFDCYYTDEPNLSINILPGDECRFSLDLNLPADEDLIVSWLGSDGFQGEEISVEDLLLGSYEYWVETPGCCDYYYGEISPSDLCNLGLDTTVWVLSNIDEFEFCRVKTCSFEHDFLGACDVEECVLATEVISVFDGDSTCSFVAYFNDELLMEWTQNVEPSIYFDGATQTCVKEYYCAASLEEVEEEDPVYGNISFNFSNEKCQTVVYCFGEEMQDPWLSNPDIYLDFDTDALLCLRTAECSGTIFELPSEFPLEDDSFDSDEPSSCLRDYYCDGDLVFSSPVPVEINAVFFNEFTQTCTGNIYCDGTFLEVKSQDPVYGNTTFDDFWEECVTEIFCFDQELQDYKYNPICESEYDDFWNECENTFICAINNSDVFEEFVFDAEPETVVTDWDPFWEECEVDIYCKEGILTESYNTDPDDIGGTTFNLFGSPSFWECFVEMRCDPNALPWEYDLLVDFDVYIDNWFLEEIGFQVYCKRYVVCPYGGATVVDQKPINEVYAGDCCDTDGVTIGYYYDYFCDQTYMGTVSCEDGSPFNCGIPLGEDETQMGDELNFDNFDNVTIYPNPCVDVINFKGISEFGSLSVSITDMQGRLVFGTLLKGNRLDLSTVHKGMYILTLYDKGEKIHSQLLHKVLD